MATIYIDDVAYEVEAGENVLKAALGLGLDLPYFCWHPELGSVGACRQCALVQYRDEEDTRGRIVMGCMTAATDGARFSLQGEVPKEFRESVVESLMLNHPHDCPVCAEGGECHLQDMTVMVGHRDRRYRGKKNTHRNQNLGPLIHHEMNRCISCYRCTRYYNDYAGGKDLSAQAAHDHVYFGRHEDGVLESEFAGNLVEVCPTGVFTDKPLVNEYTRKWDMQSAPSVCTGCAVGCNILPGERYGKLKRVHNRFNHDVNGYFLCDRGRFGGNYINDENRASFAGLRNSEGKYDAIERSDAMQTLTNWCGNDKRVAGVGSPRASLETNHLLRALVGSASFYDGVADHETQLIEAISVNLQNSGIHTPSLRQIEDADAVLVLGEDVTNTAPRVALALRQSVRNKAKQLATDMRIPLWQDEAVRNLAQDRLSPLHSVAMSDTPLDDIAETLTVLAPEDIARFGFAIAAQLDSKLAKVDGFDDTAKTLISQIAQDLKIAKSPLIVSGTASQNTAVIEAASAIARALGNDQTMLSYCLPECNSLGVVLHNDREQLSLSALCKRAKDGEIDTLIVVENDLYRRAPKAQIDGLLTSIKNLVVLDCIETDTFAQSSLALPAASSFEAQGTLVSSEGRAQRHFPVFLPAEQRRASWQWITRLGQALNKARFAEIECFDDAVAACAQSNSILGKITEASPSSSYRDRGIKIPRQTHRNSGRTAMLADISVHEPKQAEDTDSPLAYTMEGINGPNNSGALLPFVWSPGWNSNQALHKFQSEAGGALKGGTAGARLIEVSSSSDTRSKVAIPDSFQTQKDSFRLLPMYRIFGSEELSAHSPAIQSLTSATYIQLSKSDAADLKIADGDLAEISLADEKLSVTVRIGNRVPAGCASYAVGLPGAIWLAPETNVVIRRLNQQIVVENGDANG
ncbi:MAG: NADH-quinone oxidoreductase subunit G [Arenicella sp.]|jgi:NADH-quinone oxidoreductase subunit G